MTDPVQRGPYSNGAAIWPEPPIVRFLRGIQSKVTAFPAMGACREPMANMFGTNTLPGGVDPVQQVATDEQIRESIDDAMDLQFVLPEPPPPRQPLGRVARIFHRRGMWSLSADMLAQSADPDETPAQAKASDDSALPQP